MFKKVDWWMIPDRDEALRDLLLCNGNIGLPGAQSDLLGRADLHKGSVHSANSFTKETFTVPSTADVSTYCAPLVADCGIWRVTLNDPCPVTLTPFVTKSNPVPSSVNSPELSA